MVYIKDIIYCMITSHEFILRFHSCMFCFQSKLKLNEYYFDILCYGDYKTYDLPHYDITRINSHISLLHVRSPIKTKNERALFLSYVMVHIKLLFTADDIQINSHI